MKILALEFSSSHRSVAIVDGSGELLAVSRRRGEVSTEAFAMMDEALCQSGLERGAIDRIAVGIGPGSYTGIRIAIAIAQGWQVVASVGLQGIGSVEGLAWDARAAGYLGRVHLAVDAQRGEFYLATYRLSDEGVDQEMPLKLVDRAEVVRQIEAGARVVGPDLESEWSGVRSLYPEAGTLGRLAVGRTETVPGESLEPIYLRKPHFVKAPPPRWRMPTKE